MLLESLKQTDYEILDFANKHESFSVEELHKNLPHIESLEYRIGLLCTPEYEIAFGNCEIPVKGTNLLHKNYVSKTDKTTWQTTHISDGTYSITDSGKKAIQDYKVSKNLHKKEIWLKNAWIPILVSVATTLIVNWLPKLLPLILQWLSSIL